MRLTKKTFLLENAQNALPKRRLGNNSCAIGPNILSLMVIYIPIPTEGTCTMRKLIDTRLIHD